MATLAHNGVALGARISNCPIQVGYMLGRYCWGLFGPKVVAVGSYVRVGGGWVVPVKLRKLFGRGECALLRHWAGDGSVSVDTVGEVKSRVWACQYNLTHSKSVPRVVQGPKPDILYLHVEDGEGYRHELQLTGICGLSGEDRCVPL